MKNNGEQSKTCTYKQHRRPVGVLRHHFSSLTGCLVLLEYLCKVSNTSAMYRGYLYYILSSGTYGTSCPEIKVVQHFEKIRLT